LTEADRGIMAVRPAPSEEQDLPKKDSTDAGGELPPTKLEDIKSSRQDNIAMAMIQAGLAMAGGESPNALKNIAAGGISGLGAYTQLEKERRAADTEERRYGEEKQARIQRSQELRQEKDLTREARVYDTAQSNLTAIDREISRLQAEMGKAMSDEAQLAPIRTRIQELLEDRKRVGAVVNRSLRNLGYEGEDIFSAGSSAPVTPAIDYSTLK
jgi:DNA repair exonuclease SbcCD ATPase subunit